MGQGTILWIGLLCVLAVLFAITLRRMALLVRRTRDLERFQRAADDLAARLGAAVAPLVAALDALRRHAGDPVSVRETLAAARVELDRLAADGRAVRAPRGLEPTAAALAGELARAVRAAEMVEHGLSALPDARGGRELEAETALKRGALNLRHASDTVTRLAREIAAIRPSDLATGAAGAAAGAAPLVPGASAERGLEDVEGA
jgi:hypothetical protein